MSAQTLAQTVVVPRRGAWHTERIGRVFLLGAGAVVPSSIALSIHDAEASASHAQAVLGGLLLPLAPLALGLALLRQRRELASWLLLAGVPAAIGLAAWARGRVLVDPWLALLMAVTMLAFVVESARLLSLTESAPMAQVTTPSREVPARLRRRNVVYVWMAFVAAAGFVVPSLVALAAPAKSRLLSMAVSTLLGVVACRAFVIDLLSRHLQGDEPLRDALAQLRRHARRGRPSFIFYVASLAALVAMVLFAARGMLAKAAS